MFAASPLKASSHHNHSSFMTGTSYEKYELVKFSSASNDSQLKNSEGLNISWEHLRDLHECENVCYNQWTLPILKFVKQRVVCDNWRQTENLLEIGGHTVCSLRVLFSCFFF